MPAWDQIQQALYFHSWAFLWASICLNKWFWYVNRFKTAVVKEFPFNSLTSLWRPFVCSQMCQPYQFHYPLLLSTSFSLIMSVLRVSEIMFFCCLSSLLLQLHVVTVLYVSASLEEDSSISNHISPLKSITLRPLCSPCGGIRSTFLGCLYWWSAPGLWKLSAAPFSRYTALKAFFFCPPSPFREQWTQTYSAKAWVFLSLAETFHHYRFVLCKDQFDILGNLLSCRELDGIYTTLLNMKLEQLVSLV